MRNGKSGMMRSTGGLLVVVGVLMGLKGCAPGAPAPVDEAIFASYPQEGDATSYGIPLSLQNAAKFIGYYEQYSLTPTQEAVKREALTALVAPCCDDNPMYTCCCPCNLAKTVWGLSAYLIVQKSFDAQAVRDASLQWLQFTRRDYYKVKELEQQGLNPRDYGLTSGSSCYTGRCELPFRQGGCGGMTVLKMGD
jgi:hypothetical protein